MFFPRFVVFFFLFCSVYGTVYGQIGQVDVFWGTHQATGTLLDGENYTTSTTNFSTSKTNALLKSYNSNGTLGSLIGDGSALIELGFFDTDTTADITANSSTTELFKGEWTPLSTITKIGQDYDTAGDVGAGEFYFISKLRNFVLPTTEDGESAAQLYISHNEDAAITLGSSNSYDILDYTFDPSGYGAGQDFDQNNTVDLRVNALVAESHTNSNPVPIGIRFYSTDANHSHGTSKYNTIMSPEWLVDFKTGSEGLVEIDLLENNGGTMQINDALYFEFDNGEANLANISKLGTDDSQIDSYDFATSITYHDGSSTLDASTSSHILSALDGSGKITVGGDHTLTLNANLGSDISFSGDIEGSGDTDSGSTTLIKTGSGKQTLTGDVRLAGTNSGWLNVNGGTLSLSGASSSQVYTFEYLTGSGGTLELNNSNENQIEFGFANTTASQSYDGNLSLVGTGSDVILKVVSGATADDYNKEQNISGVISGSEKLIKTGVGRLVLSEDNINSGGVDIEDGTLVIGNTDNDADAGSGSLSIKKGKLEVLSGDTVSTVQATDANEKSMVGGDGTITTVTIGGDTTEITVVSPGQGISTSLSNETTTQQTTLGTGGSAASAMGDFTITNLTLNDGGVYDWEISDFSDSAVAGTDFDVLKFNTLTFDSTGTFTINILGLDANGSAGAVGGSDGVHLAGYQNLWDDSYNNTSTKSGGYNGFKFLDGSSHGNITWGGVTIGGSSPTASGGYIDNFFSVDQRGFAYHNNFWMGDWNVWYDGSGDFYLQFSAVPEPSTYMMVTGLLMVPGMSYVRRFKKKKTGSEGDDPIA